MIDLFTALLIALGFGFLALAGLTRARQRPSPRRLERVITFTFIGAVLTAIGTALIAQQAFAQRNLDLAEWVAMVAVAGCLVFLAVGYPAVHRWAARWSSPGAARAADFAERRDGNVDRPPDEQGV